MSNRMDYEVRVGAKYRLTHRLGSGAFGIIYLAEDITDKYSKVAVKMEKIDTNSPQLLKEARIMKSIQGKERFPDFKWYGEEGDYNVLVMDLLGPSLDDLFKYWDKKFSLKTVLMLMDQALQWIEKLHESNIIHRDIKPDNFCIGAEDKSEILHILDFGLSKYFWDPITKNHIESKTGNGLTGTMRYWSMNAHRGITLSRRDDLESLGYSAIYLYKGKLPWQGIQAPTKNEKSMLILNEKVNQIESGIIFEDLPREFKEYFDYVSKLAFDEAPDYNKLRRILKELFFSKGFDYNFDWQVEDDDEESFDQDPAQNSSLFNQWDGE